MDSDAEEECEIEVDITRENFERMLPVVVKELNSCLFYSFDCEMTGLFLDTNKEEFLDDMQDRYTKFAASAQSFIINQFGLSAFQRTPEGYTARTFNFYVFPEPAEGMPTRRFMCDAGSLAFLAGQGFDFNKAICQGVPFMPARLRDLKLAQITRSEYEGREVPISKEADVIFIEELVRTVSQWLAQGTEKRLLLPAANSFQRLLCYQELAKPQFGVEGYPGFYFEKVDVSNWTCIQLVRATQEEAEEAAYQERETKIAALRSLAGFTRVFEAMRDCGRPAVGHNCMFDVAYSMADFVEPTLPATWEGYKELVSGWFRGGLYDTKHLAKQFPEIFGEDTALGALYKVLTTEDDSEVRLRVNEYLQRAEAVAGELGLPLVEHGPGYEKYIEVAAGAKAHEAGYDAYMTGCVFACLLHMMQAKSALDAPEEYAPPSLPFDAVRPLVGRLNLGRSDLPYAALLGADPELVRPNVFYLHQLTQGTRHPDIMRAFGQAGLGKVRVSFINATSAYVEVEADHVPGVLEKMAGTALCAEVMTFVQYAAMKRAMIADGTWTPLQPGTTASRAQKRPRTYNEEQGGAVDALLRAQGDGLQQPEPEPEQSRTCTVM